MLAFLLANASVAIFFDGFWLLGYRIKALDDLTERMGYSQYILWFVCFFMATFLPLNRVIKERVIVKCLGIALLFSCLLYGLMLISYAFFGPFLDPWF